MHTTLVDSTTLEAHLEDEGWRIFDCRHDLSDFGAGERQYRAGHVPGAYFANVERDLSGPRSPTTGRHPLPERREFVRFLRETGIHDDTQVVAYDASGGAFAGRLWWLLRWLGHEAAAVLDGGWSSWQSVGAASTEIPESERGCFSDRDPLVTALCTEDVVDNLERRGLLLVDARTPERFRGEVEPLDPVAGHIPGAVLRPWQANLGPDGRFKSPAELRAEFTALLSAHGTPPSRLVATCGSGVSACHHVLAMAVAGFHEAPAIYSGSWSEWVTDPRRPVALGSE